MFYALSPCLALAACGVGTEEAPTDAALPLQTDASVTEETAALATEPPKAEPVVTEAATEFAEESTVYIAETEPPKTYHHVGIKGAGVADYDGIGQYTFHNSVFYQESVLKMDKPDRRLAPAGQFFYWAGQKHGAPSTNCGIVNDRMIRHMRKIDLERLCRISYNYDKED